MPIVKNQKIDISWSALFRILAVVSGVAIFFYIHEILMMVFVAIILAAAINPIVDKLQKFKVPRLLGILFIYVLIFGTVFFSFYLIIGPLSAEISNLSDDLPKYWQQISTVWAQIALFLRTHGISSDFSSALAVLPEKITPYATNILISIMSFFGGIFSLIVIAVLTFYISLYDKEMKAGLAAMLPVDRRKYAAHLISRMQDKIGMWLRGQLILSLVMLFMALIAWSLLGLKYVWVLALLAGVAEVIPYLGPVIAGAPAVFIAFNITPALGLAALLIIVLMHETENYLIVPKVMQKAVGLNPVIIIIAMMIGAKIAGIVGIILAIPVATALGVVISDYCFHKQNGCLPKFELED